jgi:hypothetical protein
MAARGEEMRRTEADSLYAASFSPAASMESRQIMVNRCVVPLLLCTGRDLAKQRMCHKKVISYSLLVWENHKKTGRTNTI